MRAMILAAGLGKRMRPLTDHQPKPLLKVGDLSLIEHQVLRLIDGGITDIVVNHFYLGSMIEEHLGNGKRFGINIAYSREPIRLDTAGGIIKSLPKLKDDCFIVVNADIWTDFPFASLPQIDGEQVLAHLVMVENAEHHPQGDFYIDGEGRVHEDKNSAGQKLTFSGISVIHRRLLAGFPIQPRSLVPLLQDAMKQDAVRGEIYRGTWVDIGTPERLQGINESYAAELANSKELAEA